MSEILLHKKVESQKIPLYLDEFELGLPRTAHIIHVGSFGEDVHIWYEYSTEEANEILKTRKFRLIPDSMPFDKRPHDSTVYIGTVIRGNKLRHLYEEK